MRQLCLQPFVGYSLVRRSLSKANPIVDTFHVQIVCIPRAFIASSSIRLLKSSCQLEDMERLRSRYPRRIDASPIEQSSNEKTGFLSLPREIRDLIYDLCFDNEKETLAYRGNKVCFGTLTRKRDIAKYGEVGRTLGYGALLYLCKAIYVEVAPIFYGALPFRMDISCNTKWRSTLSSWGYLQRLQLSRRVIHLLMAHTVEDKWVNILGALQHCCSLRDLEFACFHDHWQRRNAFLKCKDERDAFVLWLIGCLTLSISSVDTKLFVDLLLGVTARPRALRTHTNLLSVKQTMSDFRTYLSRWADCKDRGGIHLPLKEYEYKPISLPKSLRTIRVDGQKLSEDLAIAVYHCRNADGRFVEDECDCLESKLKLRVQWQCKSSIAKDQSVESSKAG